MITADLLVQIGTFNKPHGINGEISVIVDEPDIDFALLRCIVTEMDGIFVPFFISSVRSRGQASLLIKIDGVDNEKEAALFSRKPVYALKSDVDFIDDDASEGLYASDMTGFMLKDVEKGEIGIISAINDSTENVLFIVERPDGSELYIPVAEELITDIDIPNQTLTMDLPEGLLDL
ncbi:MAG: ribosome maturation factor RimM [Lachnoclostridium sp.]|nr:ribosome maturation factor RimM [Lachnoclostridium sp.]